jgi:hypothetical protein
MDKFFLSSGHSHKWRITDRVDAFVRNVNFIFIVLAVGLNAECVSKIKVVSFAVKEALSLVFLVNQS